MRILSILLISAVVGTALGAAVAIVEEKRNVSRAVAPEPAAAKALLPGDKAPRVQVDEPDFNFGKMQRGTTKSHEYVIKNVGQQPLKLSVGHTTCKCTLGEVTDKPIEPGQSSNVKLEWTAKIGAGAFRQTATINTNDPLEPQVTLNVEGQVTEASGVSPADLSFGKISAGESKSAEVFIMAMLQDELEVTEAQLSDEKTRGFFDVKAERAEKDQLPDPTAKDGVRVTVTAKSGLPIGHFNEWLSVKTNMPDAQKLEIPVMGQVVGEISVRGIAWDEAQGSLRLGSLKSDTGKRDTVNLVVRGPEAANVKFSVESCDPPELKVTVGEAKQLKPELVHVPVTIEVPAGTRPMVRLDTAQGEAGRVVLKTTHPSVPELVLGVRFSVER
jgi:hypothetical protein